MNIHLLLKPSGKLIAQQRNYFLHIFFVQCMEYDHLINSVQKFRPEDLLDLFHNTLLHFFIISDFIFFCSKTQLFRINDRFCTCIRRHDDHGIGKIYLSSL